MAIANINETLKEKELNMYYAYKETGSKKKKLELMDSLQPIVYQQVNKFKNSGLPPAALKLETKRILSDAIETYDPAQSQLNTHVTNYTKKLYRFVSNYQNIGKIPEPRALLIGRYNTIYDNLNSDKGREPTVVELADSMNLPAIEIERLQIELRSDLGMPDAGEGGEEGDSFFDLTQHTEEDFQKKQAIEIIYYESDNTDKKVLEYIFGMGGVTPLDSDKEIAFKLNLTPSALKKRKEKLAVKIRGLV